MVLKTGLAGDFVGFQIEIYAHIYVYRVFIFTEFQSTLLYK